MLAEWGSYLADLTPEEIRRGIESLDTDKPPTLPEFRKLCRPNNWQHSGQAYKRNPILDEKYLIGGRMKPKSEVAAGLRELIQKIQEQK
jgi:hypothetical protein